MTRTTHEQDAYDLGVEHAKNAASWINTDAPAGLLVMLDNGEPDVDVYLPVAPNLSGEWADSPTPISLYEEITGRIHVDAEHAAGLGYETLVGSVVDALCDAYEQGVEDAFQPECERILRAAIT